MSGLYLSGMEMPKEGNETILRLMPDGTVLDQYGHHLALKAVPVPEHGRLIDADALKGQMERNLWAIEDKAEKELGFDETLRRGMQYGHAVCIGAVNDAPTIIHADKEGEG